MSSTTCLLADVTVDQALAPWRTMNPSTLGGLLLCFAIGLVALLAVVWAVFFRKRQRRKRKHHSHRHSSSPAEAPETPSPPPPERHRHKRSRRRHRPRNPTLAEAGGLPPVRSDSSPGPQP